MSKWIVTEARYGDSEARVRELGAAFLKKAEDEGIEGLRLDVWENIGWYYTLRGKYFDAHPSDRANVSIFPHDADDVGGLASWMDANKEARRNSDGRYDSIKDAILDALDAGREVIAGHRAIAYGLESAIACTGRIK